MAKKKQPPQPQPQPQADVTDPNFQGKFTLEKGQYIYLNAGGEPYYISVQEAFDGSGNVINPGVLLQGL